MAKTGLQDTSAKEATRLKDPPQDPAGRIAGSDYAMILLENTPLAMAMFDEDLRYLIANQKWVEEFSLESISFKGRGHFEIFPELEDGWRQNLRALPPRRCRTLRGRRAGETGWLH